MDRNAMYQELIELITTDSASGQEDRIAALVTKKLKELGFTVTMDDVGSHWGSTCGNVLGVLEGTLPGSLLLCSHMDRVPNGLGIKPVEQDGVLTSDGTTILAADDVSGIAAILAGVRAVLAEGRPLPRLEVLFTVKEEVGVSGSRYLDAGLLRSKLGYIFDSPGGVGRFINAAPGKCALSVTVTGRSAHAGNEPEKGIDAAKTLCEIIAGLKTGRLDFETVSNFPILQAGGTATNVVCDSAFLKGEARSRDPEKLERYLSYFQAHCEKVAAARGAAVKVEVDRNYAPFLVEEDAPVLVLAKKACEDLGLPFRAEAGGGGMDANNLNARGISCVGVATGYSKNHTTAERIVLEDFFRSGGLCAQLIRVYAGSLSV